MSEPFDDGGPAFPRLDTLAAFDRNDGERGYYAETSGGMTLRDYFAGHALAGLSGSTPESVATWAYLIADAMLKARERST